MKETLKKLYKENFVEEIELYNFKDYYYFQDNGAVFGLKKDALTHRELQLIKSQFEQVRENYGSNEIFRYFFGERNQINKSHLRYYFIKFLNLEDDELFQELDSLLRESFLGQGYMMFKDNVYILVTIDNEELQFIDVLKSIESDFLIQVVGFDSQECKVNNQLPDHFQFDFEAFKIYKKTNFIITDKVDLLQNKILTEFNLQEKEKIKSYILKQLRYDKEMINVIRMYFETNFNLTLAAKNCFMHRNTFINKIDKFIEMTDFNIRRYEEAFLVYFALIM